MDNLSSLEITLCSNGSKLARWSNSALRRSRCRLLGFDLGGSFMGVFTLFGQTETRGTLINVFTLYETDKNRGYFNNLRSVLAIRNIHPITRYFHEYRPDPWPTNPKLHPVIIYLLYKTKIYTGYTIIHFNTIFIQYGNIKLLRLYHISNTP